MGVCLVGFGLEPQQSHPTFCYLRWYIPPVCPCPAFCTNPRYLVWNGSLHWLILTTKASYNCIIVITITVWCTLVQSAYSNVCPSVCNIRALTLNRLMFSETNTGPGSLHYTADRSNSRGTSPNFVQKMMGGMCKSGIAQWFLVP